jgi:hypothetical protein
MSWSDYLFDSDRKQRKDLISHQEEIHDLHQDNADLEARIEKLERENGEIKLVCLALIEALTDRELITEQSFMEIVRRIDREDGTQNGQYKGRILHKLQPQSEPLSKQDIKLDFSSAKQKPESFNK